MRDTQLIEPTPNRRFRQPSRWLVHGLGALTSLLFVVAAGTATIAVELGDRTVEPELSGTHDEDHDVDGFAESDGDCDDTDAAIYLSLGCATCGDGIVNSCQWNQIAKPVALDAAPGDFFGRSVSVSGDTVVVGASGDSDAGFRSGSASVFIRKVGGADAWAQVAKLTASDARSGDFFGGSVSVSGDTVVVGASGDDDAGTTSGSAYVFVHKVGGADAWTQVAKLTASDAAAFDWFGGSVSVSGDTVVVGAYNDDDAGPGSGSAYVFERNVGGADAWGQVAKLTASDAAAGDNFGWSISVGGDTVVVGAHHDNGAGSDSGSAYVFKRNAGGADAWGQVAKLTASDAAADDDFGVSVSVSDDTVVVGAYSEADAGSDSDSGSAYVFERNVGGADTWGQVAKLTASDAGSGDFFGESVSVSGVTVVVGAYNDDDAGPGSGSAYVFERNVGGADAWAQVAKLTASDARSDDFFGGSVSVSGETVVVGASGDDDAGSRSGSAYILTLGYDECDDGAANSDTIPDACRTDCTLPSCGDDVTDTGEECDDGASNSDTAPDACRTDCTFPACGDGATDTGEECDDGNTDDGDGCNATCQNEFCGDGIRQAPEECDDGTANSDTIPDACRTDCTLPNCGDGVTNTGEECDDGANNSDTAPDACRTDCTFPACGDGVTDTGEECDDGNTDDGDGCNATCQNECGNGIQEGPEECDDGTANSDTIPDACRTDCTLPNCGDGATNTGEECDDGVNNSDTAPDACRTDCTFPACGDGVIDTGEECEDGNTDDGDGCNAICQNEFCGDGVVSDGCEWKQIAKSVASDAAAVDRFGKEEGPILNDPDDPGKSRRPWEVPDDPGKSPTTLESPRRPWEVPDGGRGTGDAGRGTGDAGRGTGENVAIGPRWPDERRIPVGTSQGSGAGNISVSVSGDTVVVGTNRDGDAGLDSGSAYVLVRNVGGADAWRRVAKLTASDAAARDFFGTSVSVSGNTVVVGANLDDDAEFDSGSVYVFERNVGGADAWVQVAKLTASDATAGDYFGVSVSISGDTVVVGAINDDDAGFDSGSAYVFQRNVGGADAWVHVAKLTASDAAAGDRFGSSVSVSGDTVVVGATNDDDAGSASGSVYVFERNVGGADAWGQVAKLTASDAAANGLFGVSVSVSGDKVVVGAFQADGAVFDSGSAYVFERNVGGADAWGQVAKLTASDAAAGDFFGYSVSISGDRVVVGAINDDFGSGSTYVFERNVGAAAWVQVAKLTAAGREFGWSVSVSGDTVVVGTRSGSSYILTHRCEECDDGNTADGDGCSSTCQTEMSPNLIESGGFERSVPWRFFTNGMGMFRVVNEEAVVTIGNSGSNTQLFQRFGGLVAGIYKLDFDVKSSVVTRARTILVNETDLSWIAQAGFRARPAWSHVTSTLVVPADVPPGVATTRLSFYMPGVPDGTTLHFDNVVLQSVGPN